MSDDPKNKPRTKPIPPEAYRFRPGQSGNPGGRPKKKPITIAAEKLLSEKIPPDHPLARQVPQLRGKTWAEAIVYGQALSAVKGGTPAAKELADRVEGRVAQPITGGEGEPLLGEDRGSLEKRARDLLEAARARAARARSKA